MKLKIAAESAIDKSLVFGLKKRGRLKRMGGKQVERKRKDSEVLKITLTVSVIFAALGGFFAKNGAPLSMGC